MRCVGVTSRGIRLPVLKTGDDIASIVVDSVLKAGENEGFKFHDRDVVAITESIVARCQGNYASVDNIADDVRKKTGGDELAVIFPILSRNRFAILLKGIARGDGSSRQEAALYGTGVRPDEGVGLQVSA